MYQLNDEALLLLKLKLRSVVTSSQLSQKQGRGWGRGRLVHKKLYRYSRLPITRTFQGSIEKGLSYREFELSRVKLYRK